MCCTSGEAGRISTPSATDNGSIGADDRRPGRRKPALLTHEHIGEGEGQHEDEARNREAVGNEIVLGIGDGDAEQNGGKEGHAQAKEDGNTSVNTAAAPTFPPAVLLEVLWRGSALAPLHWSRSQRVLCLRAVTLVISRPDRSLCAPLCGCA